MSSAIEAERASTQGNPSVAQQDVLTQLKLHRYYTPIYEAFVKKKERAIKYFTTYVDPRWQYVLSGRPTLHDKISALEANVAPSHESRRNAFAPPPRAPLCAFRKIVCTVWFEQQHAGKGGWNTRTNNGKSLDEHTLSPGTVCSSIEVPAAAPKSTGRVSKPAPKSAPTTRVTRSATAPAPTEPLAPQGVPDHKVADDFLRMGLDAATLRKLQASDPNTRKHEGRTQGYTSLRLSARAGSRSSPPPPMSPPHPLTPPSMGALRPT